MPQQELDAWAALAERYPPTDAAEETLRALRSGEVDAIVMGTVDGGTPRVYTLETADRPYRELVERMTEGAALLDGDGLVVYSNNQLAALLGATAGQVLGTVFADWVDSSDQAELVAAMAAGEVGVQRECVLRGRDGAPVAALVGVAPAEQLGPVRWCVTVTDVRQQQAQEARVRRLNADLVDQLDAVRSLNVELSQAQSRLRHETLHDALTGLPNRGLFMDRLQHCLQQTSRSGGSVLVFFVDLDGFKRVNDTCGHAAGDRLLRDVAERLSSVVRPSDTVARFAGDEFLVLAPGVGSVAQARSLAGRILDALHDPPLQIGPELVTGSLGVAMGASGEAPETLVRHADTAMYRAKQAGGRRWELFGAKLRRELRQRAVSENVLRRALTDDGVLVHYQHVVDLRDGSPLGAEALVRLQQPDGSLLQPSAFIDTAEESGLVLPLGQRVLADACLQPAGWSAVASAPWFVSVNVSPRQVHEGDLYADVESALQAASLPPGQLRLEITEQSLLDLAPPVVRVLERVRALGVLVGVDDFGTGFASMSYVRHLPLDFVKIDASFVQGMCEDPHDLAMVEATLALSARLGLVTIAEGIETPEQWERLEGLGCTEGQGFLFARPQPTEQVPFRRIGGR